MSISIQTNVNALTAQDNLRITSDFQSRTIQRLTSGYRINSSGDDAAGLAIANKFRSDTAELTQGVRNANDGISQLQIIDGGMNNIAKMLDRLRTLATQSASGTFTGKRDVVNSEFQSLLSEMDRQAQSIGLNAGGTFAKSLNVYIGGGSGSQNIANAQVSLDLTKSAVDTQSLGLKGMEALNVAGPLNGTNTGTDIGASAGLQSVANIIKASTGNQMATAGYASFQFSGAGFSDAGKVSVSVNLTGVTDVDSLATAVNRAIQGSPNGTTAFKNASIIASVHTDSNGGKQLAFSSSSTAFQVQAGDQMANALLGNMNASGVGAAVNTATVPGATTAATGTFTTPSNVHLVISGGGLASPVDLHLASGSTSIGGAIADFENQFSANPSLAAAGLSMSGSTTPGGGPLSFNSSNGQQFTVEVSGDNANLLGLGSFLAGDSGEADYASIAASAAYDQTAVTGTASTVGAAAALEISLNGGASQALQSIDLTTGANAAVASATSNNGIVGGAVNISAANANLDITVTNNGTATHQVFALAADHASAGARSSTVTQTNIVTDPITVSAGGANNKFTVAVDGGPAKTLTIADGTYNTAAGFLGAVQTAITNSGLGSSVAAGWDASTGALTLTSATTGTTSSVAVGTALGGTPGASISTVLSTHDFTGSPIAISAAAHTNEFTLAVDGGAAVKMTIADGSYNTSAGFVGAVQDAIATSTLAGQVTADWDPMSHALTFTSNTNGATSSVDVEAATDNTSGARTSTILDTRDFTGSPVVVSAAAHNNEFSVAIDGQAAVKVTVDDGSYATADDFLTAVQGAISGSTLAGKVTAGYDANTHALTFTSVATGGTSSVTFAAATDVTSGARASTILDTRDFTGSPVVVSAAAHNNSFGLAIDGQAAVKLTVDDGSYATSDDFLTAVQGAISGSTLAGKVTADYDATSHALTFTSVATGATSSVAFSAATDITSGARSSTILDTRDFTGSPVVISETAHNNQFMLAIDGQAAVKLTVDDGSYATSGDFLTAVQGAITGSSLSGKVTADFDATSHALTFTSVATGASSSVAVSQATYADSAKLTAAVGSDDNWSGNPLNLSAAGANQFDIAVDGFPAVTVTVGAGVSYSDGAAFLGDVQQGLSDAGLAGKVTAGWDSSTNKLVFTATSTGAGSSLTVSNGTSGTILSSIGLAPGSGSGHDAVTNTGMGTLGLSAGTTSGSNSAANTGQANFGLTVGSTSGSDAAANTGLASLGLTAGTTSGVTALANTGMGVIGLTAGKISGTSGAANTGVTNLGLSVGMTSGAAGAATSLESIAAQIQSHFVGTAVVRATNDNKISIESTTKGANSSITINTPATNSANATLNLSTPTVVAGLNSSISDIVDNLNAQFSTDATWRAADLHATAGDGTHVTITSGNGTAFRLNALGGGAATAEDIGFGTAGTTFTGATSTAAMSTLDAFGVSQSTTMDFTAMQYGSNSQAITISANDSAGKLETNTITLANAGANRSGRSIDEAVAYINQQLQSQTSQPALQQIMAVKENDGGSEKINFVSSLGNFTVGVASSTNASGINNGTATTKTSQANGSAATMSVDTQEGAQQAITALSAAIAALGAAQAAVGKGQNQLNYAVTLAQSQITNFSAAESRIRDADVAAEAANLTKAQVLVQAAMAAMAQADSGPQAVLALLK